MLDEVAVADGRTIAVGLFGLVVVLDGMTGIGLAVGVAGVAEQAAWVINAISISTCMLKMEFGFRRKRFGGIILLFLYLWNWGMCPAPRRCRAHSRQN